MLTAGTTVGSASSLWYRSVVPHLDTPAAVQAQPLHTITCLLCGIPKQGMPTICTLNDQAGLLKPGVHGTADHGSAAICSCNLQVAEACITCVWGAVQCMCGAAPRQSRGSAERLEQDTTERCDQDALATMAL